MTDPIRTALEEAVRILSGGHPGYVGDHAIRDVQVRQDAVDRLRAALATPPASPEPVCPGCSCGSGVWHDYAIEQGITKWHPFNDHRTTPPASPEPERCAFPACGMSPRREAK